MEFEVAPNICNFILSLRDVGYSLDTAVADIIDNGITANAKNINIFATKDPKTISIQDDGYGMDEDELFEALRLGSKSPEIDRKSNDLGRFGLGLKTASFSQCKKLTVFSIKNGVLCGFFWDLDYISSKNAWLLQKANIGDYKDFEWYNNFTQSSQGTIVIWEDIDRFDKADFDSALSDMCNHLAMVFHRFIDGEIPNHKINILFNNRIIKAFNPFSKNKFTQEKLTEKQIINGQTVSITPFILPHHSKISKDEYEQYGTTEGYQKSQGFYLYREGRLLIYGTWFGLHKQCEAHKLVRIRIDINNKLDKLWKIDVKKSAASPAPQIKDCLKRIIREITEQGFRVYKQRGTILKDDGVIRYWSVKHSDGKVKYILNKEHPSYLLLKNILDEQSFSILSNYIQFVEDYIPIDTMRAMIMDNPKDIYQNDSTITRDSIIQDIQTFISMELSKDIITNIFKNNEAYKNYWGFIESYLKGIDNNG